MTIARSWTDHVGDNLAKIRPDIRKMLENPQPMTSISVGHYDMTFKAIVPIYSKQNQLLGFLEFITHFNSIAEKLQALGLESVVLVNPRYYQQLTHPFSKHFIGKHYIANLNVPANLLKSMRENGVSEYFTGSQPYKLEPSHKFLVVNQLILDVNDLPMANFLVFKPLSSINANELEMQNTNTNLVLFLVVLILGISLYLLSEKTEDHRFIPSQKLMLVFLLVFIGLISLIGYFVYSAFLQERSSYIKQHNHEFAVNYEIINRKYNAITSTVLKLIINKPEIIDLMSQAYKGESQKNSARAALLTKLRSDYEQLVKQNIRQLHFHLNNNESFLRFHRPNKFGDNLSEIRDTVSYVNRTNQAISGFEEGRIFNGFRNVYPIIKPSSANQPIEFLGSVEISYSPYSITQDFSEIYQMRASFLVKEEVVKHKVFNSEISNYQTSFLKGYFVDKEAHQLLKSMDHNIKDDKVFSKLSGEILHSIELQNIFSIESNDKQSLITFIPVINPITKESAAVFVFQQDNSELNAIVSRYQIWFALGVMFALLALIYLFKETANAQRFRLLSEKNQQILNSQKAMVIVTDGNHIIDSNEAFLRFFECPTLEEFKLLNNCICNLFEEDNRFFHMNKVAPDQNWIEYLNALPNKESLVSLKNTNGNSRIFTVSITPFSSKRHILTFTDITDTMSEKYTLEYRATRDNLTGAYNRDYFNHHIHTYEQYVKSREHYLGFILFDIDHFKSINDNHGHNAGDKILVELVEVTKNTIRNEDTLIRWGGEEFLVIIETTNVYVAKKVAENIRRNIEANSFPIFSKVTCSFGVALHDNSEEIHCSIEKADQALYAAKNAGRNRVITSQEL